MKAYAAITSDNLYRVEPMSAGISILRFKTEGEASLVAKAINQAFERGQEDIRAQIRDLLQVPRED